MQGTGVLKEALLRIRSLQWLGYVLAEGSILADRVPGVTELPSRPVVQWLSVNNA